MSAVRVLLPPVRHLKPLLMSVSPLVKAGAYSIGSTSRRNARAPVSLLDGNPATGKAILNRHFPFAGCDVSFHDRIGWYSEDGSTRWLEVMHGFSWFRDVIAHDNSYMNAATLRGYIEHWMDHSANMHALAHYPEVMGERVANWITFSHSFLRGSSFGFRRRFLKELVSQVKTLERTALTRPGIKGVNSKASFNTLKGLIYASLTLPFASYLLRPSIGALYYLIETTLLADGAHNSRSPSQQLEILKTLLEIKLNLKHLDGISLARLNEAIENVATFLRYVTHGDGRLALFNNSIMEDASEISSVLKHTHGVTLDERMPAASGFHRLERGTTLVIMDAGTPSAANPNSHCGTLSFELSDGLERIITNCGAYRGNDYAWRKVPKATAAHSTLSIDERNSWDISDSVRSSTMPRVTAMRGERDGNVFVDAVYNGYARYAGFTHSRQLYLTQDGDRLSGADILTSREPREKQTEHSVSLRFHLAPQVQVERYFDGAARLTTASGSQWVFQSSHQKKSQIEESVFLGTNGKPQRTCQIVITTPVNADNLVIEWALSRMAG